MEVPLVECSDGVLAVGSVGSDGEDAVVRGRDALITSLCKNLGFYEYIGKPINLFILVFFQIFKNAIYSHSLF